MVRAEEHQPPQGAYGDLFLSWSRVLPNPRLSLPNTLPTLTYLSPGRPPPHRLPLLHSPPLPVSTSGTVAHGSLPQR